MNVDLHEVNYTGNPLIDFPLYQMFGPKDSTEKRQFCNLIWTFIHLGNSTNHSIRLSLAYNDIGQNPESLVVYFSFLLPKRS